MPYSIACTTTCTAGCSTHDPLAITATSSTPTCIALPHDDITLVEGAFVPAELCQAAQEVRLGVVGSKADTPGQAVMLLLRLP